LQALAFTGIHVISPRLLTMMTEEGVFSIIGTYLRLAGLGERIQGWRVDGFYWRDLGKIEQLRQAEEEYRQRLFR
jgi:NDP-sugar pyrophosphorylase family protein